MYFVSSVFLRNKKTTSHDVYMNFMYKLNKYPHIGLTVHSKTRLGKH